MQKICNLEDLNETQAFGANINGVEYFVVKDPEDMQLKAYRNACPHLGIPLEVMPHDFLDPQHEYIVCANHGALFQIKDGLCVGGPCKNQFLKSVACDVQGEEVFIKC